VIVWGQLLGGCLTQGDGLLRHGFDHIWHRAALAGDPAAIEALAHGSWEPKHDGIQRQVEQSLRPN
jgi:hypothetical protein